MGTKMCKDGHPVEVSQELFNISGDSNFKLTPKECKLIEKSWKSVIQRMEKKSNGVELFIYTFRTFPHIKKVLPNFEDLTEDELRSDPLFCAMGLGILYQIDLLIEFMYNIDDVQFLASKLTKIYYEKGFKTHHYKDFCITLLSYIILLYGLKSTYAMARAWGRFLGMIGQTVEDTNQKLESAPPSVRVSNTPSKT